MQTSDQNFLAQMALRVPSSRLMPQEPRYQFPLNQQYPALGQLLNRQIQLLGNNLSSGAIKPFICFNYQEVLLPKR
jgi:hypothetical protein